MREVHTHEKEEWWMNVFPKLSPEEQKRELTIIFRSTCVYCHRMAYINFNKEKK